MVKPFIISEPEKETPLMTKYASKDQKKCDYPDAPAHTFIPNGNRQVSCLEHKGWKAKTKISAPLNLRKKKAEPIPPPSAPAAAPNAAAGSPVIKQRANGFSIELMGVKVTIEKM
jgi:hypothetical protein